MSFRSTLVVVTSTLVVLVTLAGVVVGGATVRQGLLERTRDELTRELALITDRLQIDGDEARVPQASDSLVRSITARIDHRLTLIDSAGTVISDSDVPPVGMEGVDNHSDRPEVIGALLGDSVTFSVRESATVGRPLVYAARAVSTEDGPVIVRLAASLEALEENVAAYRRRMAALGLGGLLVAVFLSLALARKVEEPLAGLIQRSRSLAEGGEVRGWDAGDRARTGSRDEDSSDGGIAVASGGTGFASGGTELAPGGTGLAEVPTSPINEIDELATTLSRLDAETHARLGELARERDRMQILVDSMAEGVLALTEDARILRSNDAARELLELPESVRFAPVGSVIRHPPLRDLLESAVIRSFQSREVSLGERNLIIQSRLLSGGGAVVTLLDVTELRRLEQVRRDFVANASHELKTPLTSVRGFAETLLEDDPPSEIRLQFLRSIRDNTVRLQRLVDDLLDLSRLESGGWVARPEGVAVAAAVRGVWKGLADRAAEKSLNFEIRGDARVRADPTGLSDVLHNLLENSIQYTPEGGAIRVDVRRGADSDGNPELVDGSPDLTDGDTDLTDGDTVVIEVTDTGIGIPSAALPRIFERFYRADPARSREEGGTGLGLAIVKHLVEAMGGEVTASSRLGRGTTLRIALAAAGREG